jgi:basic amino acid/polyamine antiporter, APA family
MTSASTLSLVDLILMGLANIVGAGIFVILGKSIKYGGNKSLYALLVIACISMVMGMCYIEIYSRNQSSITEYLAVKNALGNIPGHIMIYLIYLFAVFTCATIVISISKYISSYGTGNKSALFEKLLSIGLLVAMSAIDYTGIESSKIVATSLSVLMLITVGTLILLSAKHVSVEKTFDAPNVPWDSFVLSSVLSLFLFNGYDLLVKMSDQTVNKDDNKTALIACISITSLIYCAIIVSAICVLKYKTVSGTSNLITKMYEVLTNKSIANIIYVIGAFIMFNTAFLSSLSASRFMQGMGKQNHTMFSEFWSKTNEFGAPSNAIYATLLISSLLAIMNNEVLMAIITNTSCISILILISVSLLSYRWNERTDVGAQMTHNYIRGNINNIPIIVIINLLVLFYIMFVMIREKFWIGRI